MSKRRIEKELIDEGFGFPVRLRNVPMIWIREQWIADIDYGALARTVLATLCSKPSRLTGNEVRFIRQHHGLTLKEFAAEFCVTHPAVLKWEQAGNRPTRMNWSTEKDLRLWVCVKLGGDNADSRLATVYRGLATDIAGRVSPLSESTSFAFRRGAFVAAS